MLWVPCSTLYRTCPGCFPHAQDCDAKSRKRHRASPAGRKHPLFRALEHIAPALDQVKPDEVREGASVREVCMRVCVCVRACVHVGARAYVRLRMPLGRQRCCNAGRAQHVPSQLLEGKGSCASPACRTNPVRFRPSMLIAFCLHRHPPPSSTPDRPPTAPFPGLLPRSARRRASCRSCCSGRRRPSRAATGRAQRTGCCCGASSATAATGGAWPRPSCPTAPRRR